VAEEDPPAAVAAAAAVVVGNCKVNSSFPINEWIILLAFVQKPVYLWCVNESGLADVSSVVPGLTVWSLLAQL
jgi:hypothetical protein